MIRSAIFPGVGSGQTLSETSHPGTGTRGNFQPVDGGPTVPPRAYLGRERWQPDTDSVSPAPGEPELTVPPKAYFAKGRQRLQAIIDRQSRQQANDNVSSRTSEDAPVPKPVPRKMVIYVHGTFDSAATQPEGYAVHGGKELPIVLANVHGADKFHSYGWNGKATEKARKEAALGLASTLSSVDEATEIALVGHSHGGNVIGHALDLLAKPDSQRSSRRPNIISVDLYGTPHWEPARNPAWSLEAAALAGNITNYYSTKDSVQTVGANLANRFDPDSSSANAGRTLNYPDYVQNVDVTEHGEGLDHHSSLMTPPVLRSIHAEELRQHRAWFGSHTEAEDTP